MSSSSDLEDPVSSPTDSLPTAVVHPNNYYVKSEMERLREFIEPFPHNVQQRAYQVLQDILRSDQLNGNNLGLSDGELFSSIMFMAVVEARMPYGPNDPRLEEENLSALPVTIQDILEHGNLNINHLFSAMHVLRDKLQLSKAVLFYLPSMERNYCVVSALSHTYQTRLCPKVFRDENKCDDEGNSELPPMPETEGVSFRKKQCWLLFLNAKYHLMPDNQELFQHFQLLLCCLEFVLRQTPSFLLNSPYDSVRFDSLNAQNQGVSLLNQLAIDFELSPEETLNLQKKSTESFFQKLLNTDGELDLEQLEDEYKDIFRQDGDINELLFLTDHPHLLPVNINKANGSNERPVNLSQNDTHPGRMTPVRTAVTSVQQLLESVSLVTEMPSAKLKEIFERCTPNPTPELEKHIDSLKKEFVKAYDKVHKVKFESNTAEQRFIVGQKLYYKVLEAILEKEVSDLPDDILSIFLNKMVFHTSLLACALEVVLTTYGQTWNHESGLMSCEANVCGFPWILDVFSLQAFEFCKVFHSFIKNEPMLPMDITKHLQSVEYQILESIAWKEESALFDALGTCDMGQMTPPNASPAKNPENSPRHSNGVMPSSVHLFLSPVRHPYQTSSHPVRETSPVPAQPGSDAADLPAPDSLTRTPPQKSKSLSHFLSRVCKLGFARLSRLCSLLLISKEVQHKIWTCFEYVVMKVPFLVKNRHIDQMIMCCIFAICKVVEKDVTFKSIVCEYRNLPNAKQEIYKNVHLDNGEEDSIIAFYNRIFMQNLKSYLLQFSPSVGGKPRLSPMPKQVMASPSYSLPGKKNFMVSPLKDYEFKTPASPSQMTPATKMLYCFGDVTGSAEKLRHINERMSVSARGQASVKKRLNMDDLSVPSSSGATKARKLVL